MDFDEVLQPKFCSKGHPLVYRNNRTECYECHKKTTHTPAMISRDYLRAHQVQKPGVYKELCLPVEPARNFLSLSAGTKRVISRLGCTFQHQMESSFFTAKKIFVERG